MKKLLHFSHHAGRLLLSFLLLVITFVYAMFQGGFVSWFLFYSFIPFGLYSFLLSITPVMQMNVKRETNKEEYAAGEKFVATITINRKFPFPLFYLVVEEVLPPELQYSNQFKKSKVILFPWFKREISYEYQFDAIPRGEHIFTSLKMKTGDLIGLVEKEAIYPLPETFLVYPQYHEMIYRQIESRYEQGATASNVKLQRDTTIAVGIREYKPGDRFSWIDWKSSARKNDIMVKEFEQQQSHDVVIFIDRSTSRQFEQVVTFTTSLVRAILKKGALLSLVSVGEQSSIYPLRGGDYQFQQIYYHLAKVKADSKYTFAKTIETQINTINQMVTFMFVTSMLTRDLIQVVEKVSMKQVNLLLFVVKEKASHLSNEEIEIIELLRRRNSFVKVVYEGHYKDVFFEVSRS